METREKYIFLHTYINLAGENKVPALHCHMCDGPVALVDRQDGPVLWCPMDDSEQYVGLVLIENLKEKMDAVRF